MSDGDRKRREAMARADEAKRIVESDVFRRSWEALREQYISDAVRSDSDAGKLRSLQKIEVLSDVRDMFGAVVLNGQVAASEPIDID